MRTFDLPSAHAVLRRFAKWTLSSLTLVSVLSLTVAAIPDDVVIGINVTDSLPGLVYVVRADELPSSHGEAVAFQPPPNRFYPERLVFVKKVLGLPGDVVSRSGRDSFINGKYVATAKSQARSGEPLIPGPVGVIPAGAYFVWTPHPDSYDSRYEDIGWIPAERLVGRARRLL